jgi:hypothetical protein
MRGRAAAVEPDEAPPWPCLTGIVGPDRPTRAARGHAAAYVFIATSTQAHGRWIYRLRVRSVQLSPPRKRPRAGVLRRIRGACSALFPPCGGVTPWSDAAAPPYRTGKVLRRPRNDRVVAAWLPPGSTSSNSAAGTRAASAGPCASEPSLCSATAHAGILEQISSPIMRVREQKDLREENHAATIPLPESL